jgi:hypothetical protein
MINRSYLFIAMLSLVLSSCQMYRSQFDCPPGEGIPCTSVTDIESMVIETKRGPDVLAPSETGAWKNLIPILPLCQARKVWISDVDTNCGCHIEGHYIYINSHTQAK